LIKKCKCVDNLLYKKKWYIIDRARRQMLQVEFRRFEEIVFEIYLWIFRKRIEMNIDDDVNWKKNRM